MILNKRLALRCKHNKTAVPTGSFGLRHNAPRKARNPKTGETIDLPARVSVHFKPGGELKKRVNAESNQYPIENQ